MAAETHEAVLKRIQARCGTEAFSVSQFAGDVRITCSRDQLAQVLHVLKSECGFDMLVDITAVDYLDYPDARDRFAVIYALASTATNARLYVKAALNESQLTLPSAVPLWQGANWLEREVYDMFGIRFEGHPDLRRILMPEEFTAFPLRKDYPLRGRGERHNFPRITRHES
jgi:NADH-quinone oxidoreductase subunit C